MVPAKTNGQLANANLDVVSLNLPNQLNYVGKNLVSVLLGERVRKAMLLPQPSASFIMFINSFLVLRKWFLRYFALPRPEPLRKDYISAKPNISTGRYSAKEYLSHPWYVAPPSKEDEVFGLGPLECSVASFPMMTETDTLQKVTSLKKSVQYPKKQKAEPGCIRPDYTWHEKGVVPLAEQSWWKRRSRHLHTMFQTE